MSAAVAATTAATTTAAVATTAAAATTSAATTAATTTAATTTAATAVEQLQQKMKYTAGAGFALHQEKKSWNESEEKL